MIKSWRRLSLLQSHFALRSTVRPLPVHTRRYGDQSAHFRVSNSMKKNQIPCKTSKISGKICPISGKICLISGKISKISGKISKISCKFSLFSGKIYLLPSLEWKLFFLNILKCVPIFPYAAKWPHNLMWTRQIIVALKHNPVFHKIFLIIMEAL